jgi:hypothetical protein
VGNGFVSKCAMAFIFSQASCCFDYHTGFLFFKKIIFMFGLPFDSAQGDSFLLLRLS